MYSLLETAYKQGYNKGQGGDIFGGYNDGIPNGLGDETDFIPPMNPTPPNNSSGGGGGGTKPKRKKVSTAAASTGTDFD